MGWSPERRTGCAPSASAIGTSRSSPLLPPRRPSRAPGSAGRPARRGEARIELAALEDGSDPAEVAARELAEAETRVRTLALELRAERNAAGPAFADAVAAELRGVGMGEGEFVCEVQERDDPGSTGTDEAVFLVRPNAGLPFAPVAETASGGELSRIALAIAAG